MDDSIYLIVEGDGEEKAVPLLVRRILAEWYEIYAFPKIETINAHGGSKFMETFDRSLERTRRDPNCKGVIVMRDVEAGNCALTLSYDLAQRARKLGLPFPVVVVCPCCEYESWFLASLDTILPHYEWREAKVAFDGDPEAKCGAKEWLQSHMPNDDRTYKETRDQVKMSQYPDLPHVYEQCRSFKRMVDAIGQLLEAMKTKNNVVTPLPRP